MMKQSRSQPPPAVAGADCHLAGVVVGAAAVLTIDLQHVI
jgi:hypothetical protein